MQLYYSFVIPVYNRPEELRELLLSLTLLNYTKPYEVVIVEDGSQLSAAHIADEFREILSLVYLHKKNTGPGDSRNYGMARASGNYFIILDSDCILPPEYLCELDASLTKQYVDCFGGPDAAHESFSNIQKAINYAMTSILTTGGIRGKEKSVGKFQPRSFNMGMSKKAFESTGGFGKIHPGEDPDLSIRLWKQGFNTKLVSQAYVYHKRRIDFGLFFKQVKKFGMVRPILNKWHPETASLIYWFPSLFCMGFLLAFLAFFFTASPYKFLLLIPYLIFYILLFLDAIRTTKSLAVGILSVVAVSIQFIGYGYGFLKSTILVNFSKRKPQEIFPELFF